MERLLLYSCFWLFMFFTACFADDYPSLVIVVLPIVWFFTFMLDRIIMEQVKANKNKEDEEKKEIEEKAERNNKQDKYNKEHKYIEKCKYKEKQKENKDK